MSKHLERDIESLEQELLSLSASVENMIEKAWNSFLRLDAELALHVIEGDAKINEREVAIEEHCLKILALTYIVESFIFIVLQVILLILLSFMTKRKYRWIHTCSGRPGVVV